jgi:hypothetical protein
MCACLALRQLAVLRQVSYLSGFELHWQLEAQLTRAVEQVQARSQAAADA